MSDPYDESRVVLRAQCGDSAALETLLLGIEHALSRYISGFVGQPASEDVLQEVFVQIWRNLEWLRQPELFRPWAYRIASHACYRHLKRAQRWSARFDGDAAVEELPASAESRSAIIGGMDALLERVSPASRAALLLHYVEDLSIEDTAAILDISLGTAKSRIAYGLACLRKLAKQKGQQA